MMTGHGSTEKKRQAFKVGVFEYFEKPVKTEVLVAGIRKALA